MKTIKMLVAGAIGMLLATSCSNDDFGGVGTNNDSRVSFTVELPGGSMGSRAFADGLSADYLQYALYDAADNHLVLQGEQQFGSSLTTTVEFNLVKGVTYNVAFFAQNQSVTAAAPAYEFDAEAATVTVNYDNMMADYNSNDYEVFYKVVNGVTAMTSDPSPVVLVRPVAQINWGTNDLAEATVLDKYGPAANAGDLRTTVSVKGVYNVLDLLDGTVSKADGFNETIEFARLARPAATENFPVDNYDYLSVNYILVPSTESAVVDLEMKTYNSETGEAIYNIPVASAPVQANYRTNIYGQLLTSTVNINVEKDPTWSTPDYEPLIWDGTTIVEPKEVDGVYTITTPAELAGLAKIVNDGDLLVGKTINLMNDLDLDNQEWTPIGIVEDSNNGKGVGFGGVFNGNNHTISNLKIAKPTTSAGLFGYNWGDGEIRNLKIKGADINVIGTTPSYHSNGVLFGSGKVKLIENVTVTDAKIHSYRRSGAIGGTIFGSVKNCVANNIEIILSYEYISEVKGVDNCDKAGAIVGYYPGSGNYTFSGNTANNVIIEGGRDLGGLVGYTDDSRPVATNNSVYNATITQNLPTGLYDGEAYSPSKFSTVHEIVGKDGHNTFANSSNTASNVTIILGVDEWDGETVTAPEIDEDTKTVVVNSSSDLVGLANLVNGVTTFGGRAAADAMDFEGYTIRLTRDYDLKGEEFPMIGAGAKRSGSASAGLAFKGVLDGQGHTIKNLTINNNETDKSFATGFITNLVGADAAVKNLVFENVNISAPKGGQTGIIALVSEGAQVENIKVISGEVSGQEGVGGIVGRVLIDGSVIDCSNAANVSATISNCGGIVGAAYYDAAGKVMEITNCHNTGNITLNETSGTNCAGGIVGLSAADVTDCTNRGNVIGKTSSVGGVVGEQKARGKVTGCTNYGNISGRNTPTNAYGYGGVIGWMRYATNAEAASYPVEEMFEVTKCINHGQVSGVNATGISGIVGMTYMWASIDGCENYSTKLEGGSMVCGITAVQFSETSTIDHTYLTVKNCKSTTNTETQMTGGLKAGIVYDNSTGSFTEFENNTYDPAQ